MLGTAACGGERATTRPPARLVGAPTTSAAGHRAAAMADKPFGAGCSAVPTSGKGSFSGMAQDPVATAASNNPVLSTLVTAVKKAGLVDTLNSAPEHHRVRADQRRVQEDPGRRR